MGEMMKLHNKVDNLDKKVDQLANKTFGVFLIGILVGALLTMVNTLPYLITH